MVRVLSSPLGRVSDYVVDRSFPIRHGNALTQKALRDAVQ